MSKTLLNGVNDVLTRAGIITTSGTLTGLTDSGKQVYIDLTIQLWNETVDQICNLMGMPHSGETASSTITLVNGTREYDLPSNLVQIRWPLIDQTNGNYIWPYPGGLYSYSTSLNMISVEGTGDYEQMRMDQQIPDDWQGLPYAAAINPTTGKLRMERTPTATEDGKAYDLLYDKDLVMDEAADTFPFSDATYRGVMPVVTEGFNRRKRNDFDAGEYKQQLSRAVLLANKSNRRAHW